jgi:hypothetical protein
MNPRRWTMAIVGLVATMMGVRLWQHPMEAYGDSAAQYIEHLARVRMLDRIQSGLSGGPLEQLVALDGLYPPGLHLVELVFGGLFGHGATEVLWLGFGWWLILAMAVGALGARLAPDVPMAKTACFLAMILVPATQAAALRSYYDLPMTALLWSALAVLVGSSAWRGVWAGLVLVGAVLIKWTALPFGVVMVLASMLTGDKRAIRSGVTALSVLGCWTAAYLGAGAESFFSMGGATFQYGPEALAEGVQPVQGAADWLQVAVANLSLVDASRLVFYPTRLMTTVLAPVGALVLVFAVLAGRRVLGRSTVGLVVLIACGQLAFLLLMVPILDDRFILSLVPGLAMLAGLGAAGSERVRTLAVVAMLAVAADAHLWSPNMAQSDGDPWPDSKNGKVWVPRLGMSSSIDRRGWSRSADMRSNKTEERELLWSALAGCGGGVVGASERLITGAGDLNWWTYRRVLARVENDSSPIRWSGEPGAGEQLPRLWVSVVDGPQEGAVPVPQGWSRVSVVLDESSRGVWAVYGDRSDVICP